MIRKGFDNQEGSTLSFVANLDYIILRNPKDFDFKFVKVHCSHQKVTWSFVDKRGISCTQGKNLTNWSTRMILIRGREVLLLSLCGTT